MICYFSRPRPLSDHGFKHSLLKQIVLTLEISIHFKYGPHIQCIAYQEHIFRVAEGVT